MLERAEYAVGCLVIGGMEFGMLSGLPSFLNERGVLAEPFVGWAVENPHLALQRAYQSVRRQSAQSAIVASGAGCHAALALAGQLPADRLVLLTGVGNTAEYTPESIARTLRRLRAYARRNAVLCVADVLIFQAGEATRGLDIPAIKSALVNCCVFGAELPANWPSEHKDQMNLAVYRFISKGVLPKKRADNAIGTHVILP